MNEDAKKDAVDKSVKYLIPIINKYKVIDVEISKAITEAFHAGVQFALECLQEDKV